MAALVFEKIELDLGSPFIEEFQETLDSYASSEITELQESKFEDSEEPKIFRKPEEAQESTVSSGTLVSEVAESPHEKARNDVQAAEGTSSAFEELATRSAPVRLSGVRLVMVEIWYSDSNYL